MIKFNEISEEELLQDKKFLKECKKITYYIFEGYTNGQIAKTLSYSRSTVSSRIQYLLNAYNVKNKTQFVVKILGDMLKKDKLHLNCCKSEIKRLSRELYFLKNEIKKIIKSENLKIETKLKHIASLLN